jgi:protein-tyrosine phosphatase
MSSRYRVSLGLLAAALCLRQGGVKAAQAPVTYTQTIAPILFEHCVSCQIEQRMQLYLAHRPFRMPN